MNCRVIPGVGFICSRGARAAGCDTPGCREPHARLCDHPVKKRVRGVVIDAATCDRKMCDSCAHRQPVKADGEVPYYCRAHHEMARATP